MGQAADMVKERAKQAAKNVAKSIIKKIPPIVWVYVAAAILIIAVLLYIVAFFTAMTGSAMEMGYTGSGSATSRRYDKCI